MVLIGSVMVGVVDRFGYLRMQKSTSSNVSIGLVMGCARRFGFCWSHHFVHSGSVFYGAYRFCVCRFGCAFGWRGWACVML
jgi:hypothetical protein